MTTRRPPPGPFRPLVSVPRATLPDQARQRIAPPIVDEDTVRVDYSGNPLLVITADITLPQTPGFARRLQKLLQSLRQSLEEEAPWLTDVQINVKIIEE